MKARTKKNDYGGKPAPAPNGSMLISIDPQGNAAICVDGELLKEFKMELSFERGRVRGAANILRRHSEHAAADALIRVPWLTVKLCSVPDAAVGTISILEACATDRPLTQGEINDPNGFFHHLKDPSHMLMEYPFKHVFYDKAVNRAQAPAGLREMGPGFSTYVSSGPADEAFIFGALGLDVKNPVSKEQLLATKPARKSRSVKRAKKRAR